MLQKGCKCQLPNGSVSIIRHKNLPFQRRSIRFQNLAPTQSSGIISLQPDEQIVLDAVHVGRRGTQTEGAKVLGLVQGKKIFYPSAGPFSLIPA